MELEEKGVSRGVWEMNQQSRKDEGIKKKDGDSEEDMEMNLACD